MVMNKVLNKKIKIKKVVSSPKIYLCSKTNDDLYKGGPFFSNQDYQKNILIIIYTF